MTRFRLPLAALALVALAATGCGTTDTASGGEQDADPSSAPPAAGACLEGATECEDTGGDMGAPPPSDLPVSDGPDTPVTAPADGGGTEPDAAQATEVEPTEGLVDLRPVSWETVEVDPADQTRVTVFWWSGVAPCNALAEVRTDASEDAVTVTVVEGTVPADEPQACIEIAQYKRTTIVLDEELGPRSVLDGAGRG